MTVENRSISIGCFYNDTLVDHTHISIRKCYITITFTIYNILAVKPKNRDCMTILEKKVSDRSINSIQHPKLIISNFHCPKL